MSPCTPSVVALARRGALPWIFKFHSYPPGIERVGFVFPAVPGAPLIRSPGIQKISGEEYEHRRCNHHSPHPAYFTPVCTTEFIEFARNYPEFERRNVQLIGNSVDSVYSHIAWVRNIEENFGVQVKFPVIADLDQKVAKSFGMVHEAVSDTATVRAVFFIDPKAIIRALLYYPLSL